VADSKVAEAFMEAAELQWVVVTAADSVAAMVVEWEAAIVNQTVC
jgi:hypothetical protein